MTTCRGCKYADPLYGEYLENEDAIISCEWEPEKGLPYAWMYAVREVVAVRLNEQHNCPQYLEVDQ
ncbi:MAG: hypothetical protein VBE63_08290 [Lamprobacter sp.]|uniref:hypothetical protein n=1 Tax=Lamprobacter sp. TaxID=3100796 RepID=UPI002B25F30D|nr:hypothetical protein [Lamprobacter sp.]MEA3639928.1 hypothetical protein [Lamprobacter sp.]